MGPAPAAGTSYCDIGQMASLINRKALRQGMQYAVQDATLFASSGVVGGAGQNTCTIERLPHHWSAVNAWVKAFNLWRESEDQVLDIAPSLAGKYRDYKVFMDATHANQSNQLAGNLCPVGFGDYGITDPVLGTVNYEWDASQIVIPNDPGATPTPGATEEYFMHVVGGDNGDKSKGMIHGYAQSRARPVSPDPNTVAATGWMIQSMDVGDNLDEIETNVRGANRETPYYLNGDAGSGIEYYPGGSQVGGLEFVADLSTTQYQTQKSTGSFLANCGMLKITTTGDEAPLLRIRLAPGDYKGLMARPMQDVN
jgi:hypothetical protein